MFDKEYVIKIAVEDGEDSIKTLRIEGFDLICFVCSRADYDKGLRKAGVFSRGGVYVFTKRTAKTEAQKIYIGETAHFAGRFNKKHLNDAEQIIVFAGSSDDNQSICKDMALYIESRLIDKAVVDNYSVENTKRPKFPDPIRSDKRIAHSKYLKAIEVLWPYIGLDRPAKKPPVIRQPEEAEIFWKIPRTNHRAEGCRTLDGKFKLIKGSYARKKPAQHLHKYGHIMTARGRLRKHCKDQGDVFILEKSLTFSSRHVAVAATTGRYSSPYYPIEKKQGK